MIVRGHFWKKTFGIGEVDQGFRLQALLLHPFEYGGETGAAATGEGTWKFERLPRFKYPGAILG